VMFLGIYESPTKESYIVTEFVEGGSLEFMLRNQAKLFADSDLIRYAFLHSLKYHLSSHVFLYQTGTGNCGWDEIVGAKGSYT